MSSSDCATIIKRGYLYDKKAGILDARKKWFVLRQDPVMGYSILEYFKDEKSWIRREPPKGFINVRDIVEVLRVQDKKQTLELLCPGIGYRLMANSETDADDWAEAVRKLIIYRKDIRSMSFPRFMSQNGGGTSPLSSSPPSVPFTTNTITGPLSHHTLSVPAMFSIDGSQFPQQSPFHQRTILSNQFPTPPETITDSAIPLASPALQTHRCSDPFPSPPSSNDSASMCGSSTSFDSGSLTDGNESDALSRIPSKFKVNVSDVEKLNMSGDCDLLVSDDSMALINPTTGSQVASWPLGAIRRYGVNSVCFTFESGRYCSTGEGQFYLYSSQSRSIYNKIHFAIVKMNKEPRKASTPSDFVALKPGHSMVIPISRIPSVTDSLSSPPHYNHIEHHLKQPLAHEMYTKLQQSSPSAYSFHSSLATFTSPEYTKLSHGSQILHSNTSVPMLCTQEIDTQKTEPLYSSLKEVEGQEDELEKCNNDSTIIDEDVPPPIPPRLSKMTSI